MILFIEDYGLLIHYTTNPHLLKQFGDNSNQNVNMHK